MQVVKRGNPPSHLLLGVTAVEMAVDYSRRQLAEAAAWENVSRSADYAERYPADFPERTRLAPRRSLLEFAAAP